MNIEGLQPNFTGDILQPDDQGYADRAKVFMKTGTPALIVCPRTPDEISRTIQFARDNNLMLSVRGGGHGAPAHSTNDGGLVLDMCHFADVVVTDAKKHIVRIGTGAVWGDVAQTLGQHGLALSSGDTKTVGVGGLALIGGIGWLVRQYGLTIDSMVAAEIVLADGSLVRVTADDPAYADLFWAMRGAGTNMGVVIHIECIAHPVRNVYFGTITYALDNVAPLLTGWRDYMRTAPLELTTSFIVMPPYVGNDPMAVIMCCYNGSKEDGERVIAPLEQLGDMLSASLEQKAYASVLEDAHPPAGMKSLVHNVLMAELTDDAIAVIAQQTDHVYMIRALGGALADVSAEATAFAYRDSEVMVVAPTFVQPGATAAEEATALEPWQRVAAFGTGVYANFLSEIDDDVVRHIYPPATYERLARIKQRYDPQNIFDQNFNVKPAA